MHDFLICDCVTGIKFIRSD